MQRRGALTAWVSVNVAILFERICPVPLTTEAPESLNELSIPRTND
jgi:hypothetical protein